MKQVPKQYLTPVKEFLMPISLSDALITGGLIRDLTLGNEPRDTDVLIKTSMSIDEILAIVNLDANYGEVEGYGDGHFTNNYKLLLRDLKHGIDYLFIHNNLTIEQVIDSFDCSLNKGFACPYIGDIHPPELDEFTFNMTSGSIERFEKFSNMFINYHGIFGETNVN